MAGAAVTDAWRWDERLGVLADWYRAADAVFVGGSLAPYGGHNPMEAAACGVPVVAPAVGGIPELVRDGQTGLLAKANDLESFAAALERLLRDEGLRLRLGSAARHRAEQRFSVKHQVDQLLALWSEVLRAEVGHGRRAVTGATSPSAARRTPVSDPFNAAADRALPTVAAALDPGRAAAELKRHLPRLAGTDGILKLRAIRVIRHKPGKRCVLRLKIDWGVEFLALTVIGFLLYHLLSVACWPELEELFWAPFLCWSQIWEAP
jgi:hypothetical protein